MVDLQLPAWRVLLVDDDEEDYFLTGVMLKEAKSRKIELEWAACYQQGLARLEEKRYDAALVDYDLGLESGIGFIQEVSARGHLLPLILYTGRGSYQVDLEAMQAGATLYLTKAEANPLLLERTIRYAIERKSGELALRQQTQELEAARREAETEKRRLQAVMEALPVGVVITDARGGMLQANHAFEEVWGSPRPEPESVDDYAAYQAWDADTGQALAGLVIFGVAWASLNGALPVAIPVEVSHLSYNAPVITVLLLFCTYLVGVAVQGEKAR